MNAEKWNIFLSLQGNNEDSPPPDKKIVRPFNDTYKIMNELDVFNYFSLPQYKKIMIIGAGDGAEVFSFLIRGHEASGTTWHHSDKAYAKNTYKIDLIVADMHDMESIHSESFDGIYSYHVLEHSLSPLIALCEMRRILKSERKILCAIPSPGTLYETGLQHYSVLTNEHWKHLLNLTGFDNIEVKNTGNREVTLKATKGSGESPGKYFEQKLKLLENKIR